MPALFLLVALSFIAAESIAALPEGSLDSGADSHETNTAAGKRNVETGDKKSWLITPTLSADPKMGTNVGGVIAYLKQLDAESTPSMMGLGVSYSNTDSVTGGVGAQLYWTRTNGA